MTNNIVTYMPNQEVLPPVTKEEYALRKLWNIAASIEETAQQLHESDMNDVRRAQIVTSDDSIVSGVASFSFLAQYIQQIGRDLDTMANTMRFKCMLLDRRRV